MSEKNKKNDNLLGKKKKKLNLETFLEKTDNNKKKKLENNKEKKFFKIKLILFRHRNI